MNKYQSEQIIMRMNSIMRDINKNPRAFLKLWTESGSPDELFNNWVKTNVQFDNLKNEYIYNRTMKTILSKTLFIRCSHSAIIRFLFDAGIIVLVPPTIFPVFSKLPTRVRSPIIEVLYC